MKTQSDRNHARCVAKIRQQAARINQLVDAIREAQFTVPPEFDKRNKKRQAFERMVNAAK